MDRNELIQIARECFSDIEQSEEHAWQVTNAGLEQFAQRIRPQWLPIETCPSDVAVDVMCMSNLGNTEYFTRVTDAVKLSSGRWIGLSSWHEPTHWMPLPPPPEVQNGN